MTIAPDKGTFGNSVNIAHSPMNGEEFGRFARQFLGDIPETMCWAPPGREGTSIHAVRCAFPDDDAIIDHLFKVRFAGRVFCDVCGESVNMYRIKKYRRYSGNCCKYISRTCTTGTLFDRTHVRLTDWLHVMLYFANSKSGISTSMVGRLLGYGKDMAFKIASRTRAHMALLETGRIVGGDKVPVGISFKTMKGVRNRNATSAVSPLVMALHDTQHIVTVIIPNRRIQTIAPLIIARVHPGSVLTYQDDASFRHLSGHGYHKQLTKIFALEHLAKYQGVDATVQVYWMHLRRALRDNHVHIDRKYLWSYLGEFNFRFNRRNRSHETFWDMICAFPPLEAVLG